MNPLTYAVLMKQFDAVDWNEYQAKALDSDPSALLPDIFSGSASDAERSGFPIQVSGNLAIVQLRGPMIKSDSFFARFFGFASTQSVRRSIEAAANDPEIETIVMIVDSPGGSVSGVAELSDSISNAKQHKDVIVQADGTIASAAYWAAAGATQIFSGKNDLVGSIGARMQLIDSSEMFKKDGLKSIPIDTGAFKSAGAPGTVITEEQIADFQRLVDGFFAEFLGSVMTGRGLSEAKAKQSADGRMFFANEAIDLGLIDGIRSTDETIAALRPQPKARRQTTARAKNQFKLLNT